MRMRLGLSSCEAPTNDAASMRRIPGLSIALLSVLLAGIGVVISVFPSKIVPALGLSRATAATEEIAGDRPVRRTRPVLSGEPIDGTSEACLAAVGRAMLEDHGLPDTRFFEAGSLEGAFLEARRAELTAWLATDPPHVPAAIRCASARESDGTIGYDPQEHGGLEWFPAYLARDAVVASAHYDPPDRALVAMVALARIDDDLADRSPDLAEALRTNTLGATAESLERAAEAFATLARHPRPGTDTLRAHAHRFVELRRDSHESLVVHDASYAWWLGHYEREAVVDQLQRDYDWWRHLDGARRTRRLLLELPEKPPGELVWDIEAVVARHRLEDGLGGCTDMVSAADSLDTVAARRERNVRAAAVALATLAHRVRTGAMPERPIGLDDPILGRHPVTRRVFPWRAFPGHLLVGYRNYGDVDGSLSAGLHTAYGPGIEVRLPDDPPLNPPASPAPSPRRRRAR